MASGDDARMLPEHTTGEYNLNESSLITTAFVVLIALSYQLSPTFTTRVVEYNCGGQLSGQGQCSSKAIRRSALQFTVNERTGDVARSVDDNAGDWYIASGIYHRCAVVDSDNWQCGERDGETIGLVSGTYFRRTAGEFGYAVLGYTGWRYWRERGLMTLNRYLKPPKPL
jgi:hypothetical protein